MKACWHDWRSRKDSRSAPALRLIPNHILVYIFALLCVGCSGLTRTPAITTSQVPSAHAGAPYSAALKAEGGLPPYTWGVASGALPPGVSLDAKTGALAGVPSQVGNFGFTVRVLDSTQPKPSIGMRALGLVVAGPPPQIVTSALPAAQVGSAFQASFGAAGGVPPYHWSIASGALPSGVSLTDAGLLSGTPSRIGQFDFTVQLSDSSSPKPQTDMKSLKLAVVALALQITSAGLPSSQVGAPFQAPLAVSGGTAPYTWSASGALPTGLTLNASSGVIAGTPTAAGSFSFTVQVADSASPPLTASNAFTLSVADPSAPLALDQYGGDAKHPCAGTLKDGKPIPGATGFFYLYKDTNLKRWMFCDPLGNRFLTFGVQVMDYNDRTIVYAKYGNWFNQEVTRLRAVGFNTISSAAAQVFWPLSLNGATDGGNSNKMPWIYPISPAQHDYGVKDIVATLPPVYTDYRGNAFPDVFDAAWMTTVHNWATTLPSSGAPFTGGIAAADASPWLLGTMEDDTDLLVSWNGATLHAGWMVGVMPPYVRAQRPAHGPPSLTGQVFSDPLFYTKQQWSTWLCGTRYANIAALNAAWGSTYSTCGSTASTAPGETIGTGDGTTTSFSHTFTLGVVDPASIGISVGGALQAGDCPWFATNCGIPGTGKGTIYAASGNINGGTVTYASGGATCGAAAAPCITVTFSVAPANAVAITATYQYGGWPKATSGGTGLLDEDGTSSWWPTNVRPPDPPTGVVYGDLDNFLGQVSKQYHKSVHDWIKQQLPNHLLFGPNPMNPLTRAVILFNAAPYVDAFFFGAYGPSFGAGIQAQAIAVYNAYGVPAFAYVIKAAQPDSPYSATGCPIATSQCFSTQSAKGTSYLSDVSAMFNNYIGADGYGFVVGAHYWQMTDNAGEQGSYGLMTLNDNLYNGIESCGTKVVDSWGFTTTPEPTTGCYGDFTSPVKAANRIWLGP